MLGFISDGLKKEAQQRTGKIFSQFKSSVLLKAADFSSLKGASVFKFTKKNQFLRR
jgi:hypothetical protein